MKRASIISAVAVVVSGTLLGAQAPNQSTAPPQSTTPSRASGDQAFVMETAMDGMAEVELGKLAADKAASANVKAFGQQMVTDHGKAGDELKTVAASKQITLPSSLDAKHQATRDRLAKLSGDAFDRAYVTEMVAGHKKAVTDFTRESTSGTDSDVKAWAAKTLPTIQGHFKMAQDLEKQVAVSTSGSKK